MEILVSKTALLDKLKSVGRIIQPKNTLPAYDNFLFVIDESGFIQVTAGEEGGRISTNVDGKADFVNRSFLASAKTLLDGLKEMSEQPLTISIYEKEMVVKYANGKFTMPIEDGKQYPEMNIVVIRFCYQVMICCMGFAKFSSAVQMTNFVLR